MYVNVGSTAGTYIITEIYSITYKNIPHGRSIIVFKSTCGKGALCIVFASVIRGRSMI